MTAIRCALSINWLNMAAKSFRGKRGKEGVWVLLVGRKTQYPQINIKLILFEDIDSRKLP